MHLGQHLRLNGKMFKGYFAPLVPGNKTANGVFFWHFPENVVKRGVHPLAGTVTDCLVAVWGNGEAERRKRGGILTRGAFMRRTLHILLIGLIGAVLLAWPYQAAFAAERVVRMMVPGCAS